MNYYDNKKEEIKGANQEEQIQMWKEHFKNLLGKSPKITDKTMKIIKYLQQIKLVQFTEEKPNVVGIKIKSRKVAGLDEILLEACRASKFDDLFLWFCNAVYK